MADAAQVQYLLDVLKRRQGVLPKQYSMPPAPALPFMPEQPPAFPTGQPDFSQPTPLFSLNSGLMGDQQMKARAMQALMAKQRPPAAIPPRPLGTMSGQGATSAPLSPPASTLPVSNMAAMAAEQQGIGQQVGDTLESANRGRRLGTLSGLRDVSEGLAKMGNIPVAGDILMGQKMPAPFVAESIRGAEENTADELSPAERRMLQQVLGGNAQIPAGYRRSALEKTFPAIAGIMKARELAQFNAPYKERMADVAEGRLGEQARSNDIREEQVGTNADLRRQGLDLSRKRFAQPENAVADKVTDYDYMLNVVDQVKHDYGDAKGAVGPIEGRWNQIKGRLGMNDPNTQQLLANLNELVFTNLYAKSGKQINERERADLMQTVATAYQNGETFERMLDNVENRVRMHRKTFLGNQEARGKDVSGFQATEPKTGGETSINIGGETFTGTPEQISAYKKAAGIP